MRKAFISYSSQDAGFAVQLAYELQRSGIGVWFDKWEIKAGDSLLTAISEGLSTHEYLIVILSPASVASAWVQKELHSALLRELDERTVTVIPALYRDCNIPVFLKDKKYADFRSSFASGLMEVRLAIAPELFAERQRRFVGEIVAVDFGTSNSLVSVMENGVPRILTNMEGAKSTPSVAARTLEGEWVAGVAAVAQSHSNPQRTFHSIKTQFGTDFEVSLDGSIYRAVDIAAVIFRKLKRDAEAALGRTVHKAVLTCPARFSQRQRADLSAAARNAGFEVLRLVSEPTAALLAYGYHRNLPITSVDAVAVYDMGGGSFDVSIATPGEGIVEVNAVWGDTKLGGDDFDRRLYDHCVERFLWQHRLDVRDDPVASRRLRKEVEAAKIILSEASTARILVPYIAVSSQGAPVDLDVSITREEFESLTRDLVYRSIACCKRALVDYDMSPTQREISRRHRIDGTIRSRAPEEWKKLQPGGEQDPDAGFRHTVRSRILEVILCGLSTKMPVIRRAVMEVFGKVPVCRVDPDEAVALGAALQAGVLEGLERETLLLDVIPCTVSLATDTGSCIPILHRQTTIPTIFIVKCTSKLGPDSTLTLSFYEGEASTCSENYLLCVIEVPVPASSTDEALFYLAADVDANSRLLFKIADDQRNLITTVDMQAHLERSDSAAGVRTNVINVVRDDAELLRMMREGKESWVRTQKSPLS